MLRIGPNITGQSARIKYYNSHKSSNVKHSEIKGSYMNKKYIVALDQGTTSSRSVVLDHDANIISVAQREFTQIYPEAGWGRGQVEREVKE